MNLCMNLRIMKNIKKVKKMKTTQTMKTIKKYTKICGIFENLLKPIFCKNCRATYYYRELVE